MPASRRGEVWLVDLGIAAKVRPCLVLSVEPGPTDRVLVTLAPHTTSVRRSQFEVGVAKSFLKTGAFDVQGLVTVTPQRLLRRLGTLQPAEMRLVDDGVRTWLAL